ncbi:MAG: OmpA family protein [Kiloniellales bacterium]
MLCAGFYAAGPAAANDGSETSSSAVIVNLEVLDQLEGAGAPQRLVPPGASQTVTGRGELHGGKLRSMFLAGSKPGESSPVQPIESPTRMTAAPVPPQPRPKPPTAIAEAPLAPPEPARGLPETATSEPPVGAETVAASPPDSDGPPAAAPEAEIAAAPVPEASPTGTLLTESSPPAEEARPESAAEAESEAAQPPEPDPPAAAEPADIAAAEVAPPEPEPAASEVAVVPEPEPAEPVASQTATASETAVVPEPEIPAQPVPLAPLPETAAESEAAPQAPVLSAPAEPVTASLASGEIEADEPRALSEIAEQAALEPPATDEPDVRLAAVEPAGEASAVEQFSPLAEELAAKPVVAEPAASEAEPVPPPPPPPESEATAPESEEAGAPAPAVTEAAEPAPEAMLVPEPPQVAALPPPPRELDDMRLLFGEGSVDLSEEARQELETLASYLAHNQEQRVQLLAYARGVDQIGSRARRLSLSRALAVRAFLVEKGVRAARIDVRPLGSEATDGPPDRVDIVLVRR